jgi:hypothetical protein
VLANVSPEFVSSKTALPLPNLGMGFAATFIASTKCRHDHAHAARVR